MRLAMVIHALTSGGAERAFCTLAEFWAEAGHEVHALTLAGPHRPFYALPPSVHLHHLDIAGESGSCLCALRNNCIRLRHLRRTLKDISPDAAIGFMDRTNVLCLLATRGLGILVIATEHTVAGHWPIGPMWERLRRLTYPWARAVVVPTREGARDFSRIAPANYATIPNPVRIPPGAAKRNLPRPLLLAMGRLTHEKGFDRLVRAFAAVREKHPDWTLAILGEGPTRPNLEALGARLDLGGALMLPGNQPDPFPWLRGADLFALTSSFEGFSYALAEAQACGLPAVALDCPFGPSEIIQHEKTGVLVPPGDDAALVLALDRCMQDEPFRRGMAANCLAQADRFTPETIAPLWEALLGASRVPLATEIS